MASSVDNFFDRSVAKVKNVVSETSIEQRSFVKAFVLHCGDASALGWHEANGGNLSYRLTREEVNATRGYFNEIVGEWVPLGVQADSLRDEVFLVTGAGSQFRMIPRDPAGLIGIVEINNAGDSYRVVWGFRKTGGPTSEFVSHYVNHAIRKVKTGGSDRILYHAHPPYITALTSSQTFDDRVLSRLIWKCLPESVMFFPEGVGLVGWQIPGSKELAVESSKKAENFKMLVWNHHGAFGSSATFEQALGNMQVLEKAAQVCCLVRSCGQDSSFEGTLIDAEIKAMAHNLGIELNESFID